MELDSHKFACAIAQFLDDKLAKDIVILNISNVSSLADYFVIATGDSTPQVKALMETVKDNVKTKLGKLPLRIENDSKSRWNLLDYGDVVVHVLHREERETYAIEKFWNHALVVKPEEWAETAKEFSEYQEQ